MTDRCEKLIATSRPLMMMQVIPYLSPFDITLGQHIPSISFAESAVQPCKCLIIFISAIS